ncbi:hypothetical protein GUJ93_ZPchr0002g23231 [Zizania palustris]|uniref:Uncharacterized protein n=1 Tax=Zizania palustris TaxID=103762 RepID=A0A8J5VFQ2_ZIZPA|nr:hypothetical protein GUJ93_ZPchr0002g23231 [Zizania palustris]
MPVWQCDHKQERGDTYSDADGEGSGAGHWHASVAKLRIPSDWERSTWVPLLQLSEYPLIPVKLKLVTLQLQIYSVEEAGRARNPCVLHRNITHFHVHQAADKVCAYNEQVPIAVNVMDASVVSCDNKGEEYCAMMEDSNVEDVAC